MWVVVAKENLLISGYCGETEISQIINESLWREDLQKSTVKNQNYVRQNYWDARRQVATNISSRRQMDLFNDQAGSVVNFDVIRSVKPDINISGGKSDSLCIWETRSSSGFVTKPRFDANLMTIRFVTSGHMVYRHESKETTSTPTQATLIAFDDIRDVQASNAFSAVSSTISTEVLAKANFDLTGAFGELPSLQPIAEVAMPGINALFHTVRQIQRRIGGGDHYNDLFFPLLQEVLSYQLLSFWPKLSSVSNLDLDDASSSALKIAVEYIEANLSKVLLLSEVAAAANVGVRSLQYAFRKGVGQTPMKFIIERRLAKAHEDLLSTSSEVRSIADVARRWGFIHMGDFGKRYRIRYGCTPSETRASSTKGRKLS